MQQGYVENANVNAVMEMTRLISITRAFEMVSASLAASETSLQEAIKTLGAYRVNGTPSPPAAVHALDALDRLIASAPDLPKVRVNGIVTEVAPAFCRVSGLSPFVKLGECIELDTGGKPQLGEVVRIDESGVTVKPFDTSMKAGLGTAASRRGFVTISPHPSWKGRIINALGAPIDDGAPCCKANAPSSATANRPRPCAGSAPARR